MIICLSESTQAAEEISDQLESASSQKEEFKDFRMIDEIILELEKAYPSNSYENIIADHVRTVHWPFAGSVTRLGDF